MQTRFGLDAAQTNCAPALLEGLEECQEILRGDTGLYVVDRVEDEPSPTPENIDALAHLFTNVLRCTEGKGLLCVDAATHAHQSDAADASAKTFIS